MISRGPSVPAHSLQQLQAVLGYRFVQTAQISCALTHRSFGEPNNERLEFLGDSILNCVIAAALFHRFPDIGEGALSRLRAKLVRQEGLHEVAQRIGLGEMLRLGEGERRSGGHRRPSILADALEAVFAAVFLDGGFAAARTVIERLYAPQLENLQPNEESVKDAKSRLQEWLQGRHQPRPEYVLLEVIGEAHAQTFIAACHVAAFDLTARGEGSSRRAAEQAAASEALQILLERADAK